MLRDLEGSEPKLRLFHAVAVNLEKNGLDIYQYAMIIRVRSYLKLQGLAEDEMEVLMTQIIVACKWFCTHPHKIVEFWTKFSNFIGAYGKTPLEVRKKIEEKITLTENLEQEILDLSRKKVLLFRHCRTIESNTKFLLCNRRFPDQLNYLRQTNLELRRRIEALRRTIKEQQTQIKSMENKEENRDFFYVGREIFEGELGKLNSITGGRLKVEDIIQTARDIIRQPSKYPHMFLPIVDKILAIPNVE